MASFEARLDALCKLARLLSEDAQILAEVTLAWNEPERYVAQFAERLLDRGIEKPFPELAFIALCDALKAAQRCREIDWREDPKDMLGDVRALLGSAKHNGWKAPKLDAGEELADLLGVVGSSLEAHGLSLCQLDHASDSYALVVLPTAHVERASELAQLAAVGRLAVFRVDGAVKPLRPIRLRTVETIEVAAHTPAEQVIALPGRRLVTFDGHTLVFLRADGARRVALTTELAPDFDAQAPAAEHALFRSGQAFGVVSHRFVRLWTPQGESSLYRADPPLAPDIDGAVARVVRGGMSDDPKVVVAVFHRANNASDAVHPVVLRLNAKKHTASFGELDPHGWLGEVQRDRLPMSSTLRQDARYRRAVQLGSIAWLGDALYIVATGDEEHSPSYAVYARYTAPLGELEQLIDLGQACVARVSSSRAYLLVTYANSARPTCVCELAPPLLPPRSIELPSGATLVDHEDEAFWYFEPRPDGGRYVLAEPI